MSAKYGMFQTAYNSIVNRKETERLASLSAERTDNPKVYKPLFKSYINAGDYKGMEEMIRRNKKK